MNSTRRNGKLTNDSGNPYKNSTCFVWCGSTNVTLEPLNNRNLSQNIYYSVNKRNRWNIEQELMQYVEPMPERLSLPLYCAENCWANESEGYPNVGRVAHKRRHNVIQVERFEQDEDDASLDLMQSRAWYPKKRHQHRNHHRPNAGTAVMAVDASVQTARDTAFVVFPRHNNKNNSNNNNNKNSTHRNKVTATRRAHRGRRQGKRAKHSCPSTQLLREMQTDLDCETELHTDEENEHDFTAFMRFMEYESLCEVQENNTTWFGDDFPTFDDTYFDDEEEDVEVVAPIIKWNCNEPTNSLLPKFNSNPIDHRDLISQFELLLCNNKSTLEYLQTAVEQIQTYALWKYLKFVTAPFDDDIPLYPDDLPQLFTYSVPSEPTCSTWPKQLTLPWTVVGCSERSQPTTWTNDWIDLWQLSRGNAVLELNPDWSAGSYGACDIQLSSKLMKRNFMMEEITYLDETSADSVRFLPDKWMLPMTTYLPITEKQASCQNTEPEPTINKKDVLTEDELAMLHILLSDENDENENDQDNRNLFGQCNCKEYNTVLDECKEFEMEFDDASEEEESAEEPDADDDWVIVDFDSGTL